LLKRTLGTRQLLVLQKARTGILTGEVDSGSEYQAVAENAYEAGAVVVQNELEIQ
jgi:hypothetical protein